VPKFISDAELVCATGSSVGIDIPSAEDVTIGPNEWKVVSTGVSWDGEDRYFTFDLQIRPRSGLAANHGITVLNAPATIDPDYKGEIKVILINYSNKPFVINKGDRIAQAVVHQCYAPKYVGGVAIKDKIRGDGGMGSSGI
jgi:dUTP pyrophosphatase